jgi:hypothetical protein
MRQTILKREQGAVDVTRADVGLYSIQMGRDDVIFDMELNEQNFLVANVMVSTDENSELIFETVHRKFVVFLYNKKHHCSSYMHNFRIDIEKLKFYKKIDIAEHALVPSDMSVYIFELLPFGEMK